MAAQPHFSAMTVNERLFVAHLLDDGDSTIIARDRQRAIEVLGEVGMDGGTAARTVDAILANPSMYGCRLS